MNLTNSIICTMRKQPKYFLEKKVSDFIYLEPPTNNEIVDQITSLKNKAVGHDNIQPFFIKVARFVISPYLNLFLNFVFTEGIFPSKCKVARIVPVYQIGSKR